MIGGIITAISGIGKAFFGAKQAKAEIINKAIGVVGDINKSDDARAVAAAQIITAEARSESVITRVWRPAVVLGFTTILFAYFFGFIPENVTPRILDRIFDIVEYSVLGYMGMRSMDKWIRDLSLGSIIKKIVEKKL